nr:Hpt domain-containing protein [Aquitalea sp. LB_tupeE]
MRQLEATEPWRGHTPVLLAGGYPLAQGASGLPLLDAGLPWPPDDAAWRRVVTACLPEVAPRAAPLPVLDRQVLFALSQGDWALELPLLQDFARDKQADLLQLLQAWQQGDQANVILLAHRIKGASRTVGAARLADCAAQLEQAARVGLLAADMGLLLELEQALEDFVGHLQR